MGQKLYCYFAVDQILAGVINHAHAALTNDGDDCVLAAKLDANHWIGQLACATVA